MPSRFGSRTRLAAVVAVVLAVGPGCRPSPEKTTTLRIATPEPDMDAEVYVDGNYVGQVSALVDRPILLAPGVHRVEVRKPGRFPVQRTVRIERDAPSQVVIEAELLEDPQ